VRPRVEEEEEEEEEEEGDGLLNRGGWLYSLILFSPARRKRVSDAGTPSLLRVLALMREEPSVGVQSRARMRIAIAESIANGNQGVILRRISSFRRF